jgi:hypothetical protein
MFACLWGGGGGVFGSGGGATTPSRHRLTNLPPVLMTPVANTHIISVADPGYLSRIQDRDFYPSRIPDLGSQISDPGSKNR